VMNYPSTATVHKLAAVLAWAGRKDEAQIWLDKICRISPPNDCDSLQKAWSRQALHDEVIKSIQWGAKVKF
jgi:hypothetical protein